jgi:hypothetical protein
MKQNGDLEIQITDALEQYLSAEPLAGMEQRILNRVRLTASPRRGNPWLLVVACSLSVFICIHLWPVRLPDRAVPSARAVSPAPQLLAQPVMATARVHHELPRKPNFLAPAPFTPEERALLSLVELHPLEARQVFTDLSNRATQPIEIPAIEVPPLSEDSSTPKEN